MITGWEERPLGLGGDRRGLGADAPDVASILRDCGFSVQEAANGEEALARLRVLDHPSLAILDWNMPVLDGLETARAGFY